MSSLAADKVYETLLRFLERLDEHRLPYTLASVRLEAIMVQFALPGERWEVEVLDDGAVAVERFRSDGTIAGDDALADLGHRLAAETA